MIVGKMEQEIHTKAAEALLKVLGATNVVHEPNTECTFTFTKAGCTITACAYISNHSLYGNNNLSDDKSFDFIFTVEPIKVTR